MTRLKDLHFLFAVADGHPLFMCWYLVPYVLGVPYASMTTVYQPNILRSPALPSFVPVFGSPWTEKMTFFQRVNNILSFIKHSWKLPAGFRTFDVIKKHLKDKQFKTWEELALGASLHLQNSDPLLDYPKPYLPNVIQVGGLTTRQGEPLPRDMESFIQRRNKSTIIISFGSVAHYLPDQINKIIYEGIVKLPYTVIWKYYGAGFPDVPDHVLLSPWLPQNDLLAHPKVKLFITHCGNNGQFEGLYHGVPMLGIPLFAEQLYNANRMVYHGYGSVIKHNELTPIKLFKSITEVVNNKTFFDNIKKASQIFRHRPQVPRERAAYWIDHVIRFGPYLTSYAYEMSLYQFYMLDVIFFISIVFILFLYVIHFCINKITKRFI